MKTLRRTSIGFIAAMVLISCKTDEFSQESLLVKAKTETIQEPEMLPFKANINSVPNIDSEFITYVFPDSGVVSFFPKFSTLTGMTTYLGKLDRSQSPLTVRNCSLDQETANVESVLDMTLKNKKGDGLRFLGTVLLSVNGPTSGILEVIEGYGEFKGATGWIAAEGFVNTDVETTFLSVEGMVTQARQ